MSRKTISVDESLTKKVLSKKIMNEIMYYLRRLVRLTKQAQTLSVLEGLDTDDVKNLESLIDELEDTE